jgi:1,2-dihydroxy-3-keto-5-methylthiopentene dioxygenase
MNRRIILISCAIGAVFNSISAHAAIVEYKGKVYSDAKQIDKIMADEGVPYERWVKKKADLSDDKVLAAYADEIERLKKSRDYQEADLVSLSSKTPNLDAILAKFDKEHHHIDDEVRYVIEGEGTFIIASKSAENEWLKFTAQPGDLIIVPAMRRHFFLLTDKKAIRCIRLFKTAEGWKAFYEKPNK